METHSPLDKEDNSKVFRSVGFYEPTISLKKKKHK